MNLLRIEIVTDRLLLKPISIEYKKEIFSEFTEEITTYLPISPPLEISETELFIEQSRLALQNGKTLNLVLLSKDSEEFLGGAGVDYIDTGSPKLGVWLKKSAQGYKYGLEVITALKKWVEDNLNSEKILYPVDKANIASRKIAESLKGEIIRKYDCDKTNGETLHVIEYNLKYKT